MGKSKILSYKRDRYLVTVSLKLFPRVRKGSGEQKLDFSFSFAINSDCDYVSIIAHVEKMAKEEFGKWKKLERYEIEGITVSNI